MDAPVALVWRRERSRGSDADVGSCPRNWWLLRRQQQAGCCEDQILAYKNIQGFHVCVMCKSHVRTKQHHWEQFTADLQTGSFRPARSPLADRLLRSGSQEASASRWQGCVIFSRGGGAMGCENYCTQGSGGVEPSTRQLIRSMRSWTKPRTAGHSLSSLPNTCR